MLQPSKTLDRILHSQIATKDRSKIIAHRGIKDDSEQIAYIKALQQGFNLELDCFSSGDITNPTNGKNNSLETAIYTLSQHIKTDIHIELKQGAAQTAMEQLLRLKLPNERVFLFSQHISEIQSIENSFPENRFPLGLATYDPNEDFISEALKLGCKRVYLARNFDLAPLAKENDLTTIVGVIKQQNELNSLLKSDVDFIITDLI